MVPSPFGRRTGRGDQYQSGFYPLSPALSRREREYLFKSYSSKP
jgi:hypothetical protein